MDTTIPLRVLIDELRGMVLQDNHDIADELIETLKLCDRYQRQVIDNFGLIEAVSYTH